MHGQRVVVTGGAGFLGSHFVRLALHRGAARLVNVDALTYAGDLRRLGDLEADERYRFLQADVTASRDISDLFRAERPDLVVHYAAESHVTRSERDPEPFRRTNIEGTRSVLDACLAAGVQRVIHISTDEVYGPILQGAFAETDKRPGDDQAKNPYAKSKALADDLACSYAGRLEVCVARPTNAFGPWQYPEKALPRWITRGLRGEPLLVWGDGLYVRQWLFAEDFATAIAVIAERGEPGGVYNVGPRHDPEIANLDLARWIVERLGLGADHVQLTEYDRPDHDRRYAVDSTRIRELGWDSGDVWSQFDATLQWYRDNEAWWRPLVEEAESIYTPDSS